MRIKWGRDKKGVVTIEVVVLINVNINEGEKDRVQMTSTISNIQATFMYVKCILIG